jgi:hypothetical protein
LNPSSTILEGANLKILMVLISTSAAQALLKLAGQETAPA